MSHYFDNAATTYPKPEIVYSFMDSFYREHGGNAGRGQYKLAANASRLIAETRILIQEILDCPNKDVIFTPSATIALNMVIQGVITFYRLQGVITKKTKVDNKLNIRNESIVDIHSFQTTSTPLQVYISPFEHNSVTRVLHHFEKSGLIQVRELLISEDFIYLTTKIEEQFTTHKPNIVIVSHASNVMGFISPVLEIFTVAKKYGALTITDMAQTAGLVQLQTGSDLIDFAVFAGHKTLYGPIGIGGFVKSKHCILEPVLFGGTGVESANQDMPNILPSRYEMGSQNIQAISGFNAALKWFKENQQDVQKKEEINHKRLIELLQKYDFIKFAGPQQRENCIGVVSCLFESYSAEDIGNVLDEKDIAVRTGLQCSPLAHKFLGTFPAGTVRFSVGYFTKDEDFAALNEALDYIKENR